MVCIYHLTLQINHLICRDLPYLNDKDKRNHHTDNAVFICNAPYLGLCRWQYETKINRTGMIISVQNTGLIIRCKLIFYQSNVERVFDNDNHGTKSQVKTENTLHQGMALVNELQGILKTKATKVCIRTLITTKLKMQQVLQIEPGLIIVCTSQSGIDNDDDDNQNPGNNVCHNAPNVEVEGQLGIPVHIHQISSRFRFLCLSVERPEECKCTFHANINFAIMYDANSGKILQQFYVNTSHFTLGAIHKYK